MQTFPTQELLRVDSFRDMNDDLLIFDRTGNIISSRLGGKRRFKNNSFLSVLSKSDAALLTSIDIDAIPERMSVLTDMGIAVIFSGHLRSTGLFEAVLPSSCSKVEIAEELLFSLGSISELSEELSTMRCKTSKCSPEANRFEESVVNTARTLGVFGNNCFINGDFANVGALIPSFVLKAARLCGACADITLPSGGLYETNMFAADAFVGITLLLMLLARKVSEKRSIDVSLENVNSGILVTASFDMIKDSETPTDLQLLCKTYPEIEFCEKICSRYDFMLECSVSRGKFTLTFMPKVRDVGLIGLKNRFNFELW